METLLIIEDDPEITSALARGLRLHGFQTNTENRADRGLMRLQTDDYDGAIVDVMLGADSGVELVRAARAAGVAIPILMLSALSDVDHRTAGLEAGADDYVVKPFSFDELISRLRVQMHRVARHRPARAQICGRTRTLSCPAGDVVLTEREYDVLVLLVTHKDAPLSRDAIFDALWAAEGSTNQNVVDVYIGYLRKKLSTHDFGMEIKTLRNKGFCLVGVLPKIEDP